MANKGVGLKYIRIGTYSLGNYHVGRNFITIYTYS